MKPDTSKDLIMSITGMTAEAYELHKTDTAVDYLNDVLEFDQWGRTQLIQSSHFWLWWNNQWALRNEKLVHDFALDQLSTKEVAEYREVVAQTYLDTHQIATLNIYPNRVVMEGTFNKMVSRMLDGRDKQEVEI